MLPGLMEETEILLTLCNYFHFRTCLLDAAMAAYPDLHTRISALRQSVNKQEHDDHQAVSARRRRIAHSSSLSVIHLLTHTPLKSDLHVAPHHVSGLSMKLKGAISQTLGHQPDPYEHDAAHRTSIKPGKVAIRKWYGMVLYCTVHCTVLHCTVLYGSRCSIT